MKQFLMTGMLMAATLLASPQQSEKAKQILDEVSKKTQSFTTISADFSYAMINKEEGINENYTGSIILKGKKYNVRINGLGMQMVSDGQTIWTYLEDANEVTIAKVGGESSDLMDPSKIFTIYEKGFTYNLTGEKTEGGKAVYQIELVPDGTNKEMSKINITIDKSTMMISSAVMGDGSGTQFIIKVTRMETNKPAADSQFTFDKSKHKDIEVIDYR
jgi:outer membrane lipoprotein-sorting protein